MTASIRDNSRVRILVEMIGQVRARDAGHEGVHSLREPDDEVVIVVLLLDAPAMGPRRELGPNECRQTPSAGRREAVQFMYANPKETGAILAKVWAPLPPDKVQVLLDELLDTQFYSEGAIEQEPLDNVVRAMKLTRMLDTDVDIRTLIDTSFLPTDLTAVK